MTINATLAHDIVTWLVNNCPAHEDAEGVGPTVRIRPIAARDGAGFLCCTTPGCRVASEYAEPESDGFWQCGECRAVVGW